jgi:hypothetical protein
MRGPLLTLSEREGMPPLPLHTTIEHDHAEHLDDRLRLAPKMARAGGIKILKNQKSRGLALARSGAQGCTGSTGHSGDTQAAKPVTPRMPALLRWHLMKVCLNGDLFKICFIAEKIADCG